MNEKSLNSRNFQILTKSQIKSEPHDDLINEHSLNTSNSSLSNKGIQFEPLKTTTHENFEIVIKEEKIEETQIINEIKSEPCDNPEVITSNSEPSKPQTEMIQEDPVNINTFQMTVKTPNGLRIVNVKRNLKNINGNEMAAKANGKIGESSSVLQNRIRKIVVSPKMVKDVFKSNEISLDVQKSLQNLQECSLDHGKNSQNPKIIRLDNFRGKITFGKLKNFHEKPLDHQKFINSSIKAPKRSLDLNTSSQNGKIIRLDHLEHKRSQKTIQALSKSSFASENLLNLPSYSLILNESTLNPLSSEINSSFDIAKIKEEPVEISDILESSTNIFNEDLSNFSSNLCNSDFKEFPDQSQMDSIESPSLFEIKQEPEEEIIDGYEEVNIEDEILSHNERHNQEAKIIDEFEVQEVKMIETEENSDFGSHQQPNTTNLFQEIPKKRVTKASVLEDIKKTVNIEEKSTLVSKYKAIEEALNAEFLERRKAVLLEYKKRRSAIIKAQKSMEKDEAILPKPSTSNPKSIELNPPANVQEESKVNQFILHHPQAARLTPTKDPIINGRFKIKVPREEYNTKFRSQISTNESSISEYPKPIITVEPSRSSEFLPQMDLIQCPFCKIIYKSQANFKAHMRLHDSPKSKMIVDEKTKKVYEDVEMKLEKISNQRNLYVQMPDRDYGYLVHNTTPTVRYLNCVVNFCNKKGYEKNGKFYLKVGEYHKHGKMPKLIEQMVKSGKMERFIEQKQDLKNKIYEGKKKC